MQFPQLAVAALAALGATGSATADAPSPAPTPAPAKVLPAACAAIYTQATTRQLIRRVYHGPRISRDERSRIKTRQQCASSPKARRNMLREQRRQGRLRDERQAVEAERAAAARAMEGLEAHLASIASCESGGDPTAIGGGGSFRGKYQFTLATWRSVGGKGDPADASEAEQDRRAAMLLRTGGAGHWPVCG